MGARFDKTGLDWATDGLQVSFWCLQRAYYIWLWVTIWTYSL